MHRRKTTDPKDNDDFSELKNNPRKKFKKVSEEDNSVNLIVDSDDEDSSSKSRSRKIPEKPETKLYRKASKTENFDQQMEEDVVDGNDDECYLCEDGGEILCCDNCYRSFHLDCVKLSDEPAGDWLCPYCIDLKDPAINHCPNCKKSHKDTPHYKKLTCSKCLRYLHLGCTKLPLSLIIDSPINKNFIFEPQIVKEIKQYLHKHPADIDDLIKIIYEKHAFDYLFYICESCIKTFGFAKIKNSSKQEFDGEPIDYYQVKLKRSSDIHTFWVSETHVKERNQNLLRHFRKNFEGENEDGAAEISNSEENDEMGEKESFRVEKILACKKPLIARKKNFSQVYEDIMGLSQKSKSSLNNYKFLIKWEDLEYKYTTWEDQLIIIKFKDKVKRYFDLRKKKSKVPRKPSQQEFKPEKLRQQPDYIQGKLLDHQLEGFSWLQKQYNEQKNAILADEMGLGKTIQSLCFLQYLSQEFNNEGPFLIVAPTSTVYNWQREASKWTPNLDTIIYMGDGISRKKIMEYEFIHGKKGNFGHITPRFNMAITTYTYVNSDIAKLKKIKWEVIVVDEAQRLKNSESKLYKLCGELGTNFKLLLTGTPIQNSVEELINLVKYIIPNKPKTMEEIDDLTNKLQNKPVSSTQKKSEVSELEKDGALKKLKTILKNHMLRRTVQDANLNFPELEEKIVKLNLTNTQKHLYKNIILKNYSVLNNAESVLGKPSAKASKRSSENLRVSLINILMHLRLVCDHPDLFYSRSVNLLAEKETYESDVINSSNKLKFLDKMIPRLLKKDHKILIFTQFVLMLDIIEEFLIFKNLEYERLDGTTRNSDRQRIIDNFNNVNGKAKVFILSTRAGGLGINLTSSDTVIFVDSDFNPYRDIQAFCRAYRIGQKNKVMVYRLVSKYTVEEKIVENATKKMMLGEMIINPIETSKSEKGVIDSILKHGAKELFDKTFNQENEEEEITEEKLEELLNRDKTMATQTTDSLKSAQKKLNDLNDFYLGGFNFVDFNFTPIIQTNSIEETKENKYWETILSQDHASFLQNNEEDLGKGKRNKRNPQQKASGNAAGQDSSESIDIQIDLLISSSEFSVSSNSDSEFEVNDIPKKKGKGEYSSEEEEEEEKPAAISATLPENLQNYYSQLGVIYDEIKGKDINELQKLCLIDDATRLKFVEFIIKFGIAPSRIEDTYKSFINFLEPCGNFIKPPDALAFKNYMKFFYACALQESSPNPISDYFFFKIKVIPQFWLMKALHYAKTHYFFFECKKQNIVLQRKNSKIQDQIKKLSTLDYSSMLKKRNMDIEMEQWTNVDDYYLFEGICEHGMDEWDKIIKDAKLWYRTGENYDPQEEVWRMIFRKIEGRNVLQGQEEESFNFVKEYLKIRANILFELLLEEKEKKSLGTEI